jgi:hypothetical protein
MEFYRLQAASQQQQHLQQVAVQQRMLLAQMQAEYNQQQQEQAYTAHDQRLAAQASIQANLRQRQAEQMYAQYMEQQNAQQGDDAQALLLQRFQLLQLAAMQEQSGVEDGQMMASVHSQSRRSGASPRSDSPSNAAAKEQMRRERQVSSSNADHATSWRSTSLSMSKEVSKEGKAPSSRATPSIVVDDSASEKSEGAASGGFGSDNETPETSEEDIGASSEASTIGKDNTRRLSGVGGERRVPSALSVSPKPLSLSQAPRHRAFTAEAKLAVPANGASMGASRQPRGPPTEFHAINFTSRLSARTRREAMSKLCASPRAASFSTNARSAVIA